LPFCYLLAPIFFFFFYDLNYQNLYIIGSTLNQVASRMTIALLVFVNMHDFAFYKRNQCS
jgi:hypothetical protein